MLTIQVLTVYISCSRKKLPQTHSCCGSTVHKCTVDALKHVSLNCCYSTGKMHLGVNIIKVTQEKYVQTLGSNFSNTN